MIVEGRSRYWKPVCKIPVLWQNG